MVVLDDLAGEKRFCSQFCADKDAEVIRKREERKKEALQELEESKTKAEEAQKKMAAEAAERQEAEQKDDSDDEEFSAEFEEALVAKYIGGMAS